MTTILSAFAWLSVVFESITSHAVCTKPDVLTECKQLNTETLLPNIPTEVGFHAQTLTLM